MNRRRRWRIWSWGRRRGGRCWRRTRGRTAAQPSPRSRSPRAFHLPLSSCWVHFILIIIMSLSSCRDGLGLVVRPLSSDGLGQPVDQNVGTCRVSDRWFRSVAGRRVMALINRSSLLDDWPSADIKEKAGALTSTVARPLFECLLWRLNMNMWSFTSASLDSSHDG